MAAASASPFSSSSVVATAAPWQVLDCRRHGRVLLQRRRHTADGDDDDDALGSISYQYQQLVVWDPVTGDQHELPLRSWPKPTDFCRSSPPCTYVVLCAAAAAAGGCDDCDHSGCRGGPFLVLCAGVAVHPAGTGPRGATAYACVYSSQLRAWSSSSSVPALLYLHDYQSSDDLRRRRRGVVIGHEAYLFRFSLCDEDGLIESKILKYDIRGAGRWRLSAIESPDLYGMGDDVQLMETEDGLLGLASTSRWGDRIHLWSRTMAVAAEAAGERNAGPGWVQRRVIDLRAMSTRMISSFGNDTNVIGFAEGVNAILVSTDAGTFLVDVKSERARKVCNAKIHKPVIPFVTFYSPGCAFGKLPLPVETN